MEAPLVDLSANKGQIQKSRQLLFFSFSMTRAYWNQCNGKRTSTTLRCWSFSEKNIEKKHLYHHDKNCCYFCKSNIPVINLIVSSRNMIKLSKKIWVCKKLDKRRESFSPNTDNFLALLFLNGAEYWKVQWINRKWYVMQNYVLIIFLWTFPY